MAETTPIYETTLNILREAGFVLRVVNERVAEVNNKVIRTAFANYLNVTNGDAVATVADVAVTVNGTAVEVSAINATDGSITLASTPAEGATIEVSYYYSPITLDYVGTVRQDAQCAINSKMRLVDPCSPYAEGKVPYCVRMITRLWAAGLLLARDYGYNTDVELSSKDGYKKIEEAKSLLEDFYKEGGACGSNSEGQQETSGGSGAVIAGSDGDMFVKPSCHCRDESDLCFDVC